MRSISFIGLMMLSAASGCAKNRCVAPHDFVQQVNAELKTGRAFRLEQFTPFKWEKMYIFPPFTPTAKAAELVGGEKGDLTGTTVERNDQVTLLVFAARGQIVKCMDFPRASGDFSEIATNTGVAHGTPMIGRTRAGSLVADFTTP